MRRKIFKSALKVAGMPFFLVGFTSKAIGTAAYSIVGSLYKCGAIAGAFAGRCANIIISILLLLGIVAIL